MKNCAKCGEQNQQPAFSAADPLTEALRRDLRERVELTLSEEIDAAFGAGAYERVATRLGYRNGTKERAVSTAEGKVIVGVPRGRWFEEHGGLKEYHSHLLPRYARRAPAINAALMGMYLGGVNTRRVKAVLRPLLRGTPLSKSAISRLVQRLKGAFEQWQRRPLDGWRFAAVYLDAIYLKARFAGRVSSVPVLAVVGVTIKGEKVLVSLQAKGSESQEAWQALLQDLVQRGLKRAPKLVIIDGNPRLRAAVGATWPMAQVQRCVVHTIRTQWDARRRVAAGIRYRAAERNDMAHLQRIFSHDDALNDQLQNGLFVDEAGLIETRANPRGKRFHAGQHLGGLGPLLVKPPLLRLLLFQGAALLRKLSAPLGQFLQRDRPGLVGIQQTLVGTVQPVEPGLRLALGFLFVGRTRARLGQRLRKVCGQLRWIS